MAAEVIHGAPCRFTDPARFSLAHGGKDGHPYPVPLRVYDETLAVLRRAVDRARLGEDDRLVAIRRLDEEARRLEAAARGPSFEAFAAGERQASRAYGGRSVLEGARPATPTPSRRRTSTATASATSTASAGGTGTRPGAGPAGGAPVQLPLALQR
jgi:hypothetical protein